MNRFSQLLNSMLLMILVMVAGGAIRCTALCVPFVNPSTALPVEPGTWPPHAMVAGFSSPVPGDPMYAAVFNWCSAGWLNTTVAGSCPAEGMLQLFEAEEGTRGQLCAYTCSLLFKGPKMESWANGVEWHYQCDAVPADNMTYTVSVLVACDAKVPTFEGKLYTLVKNEMTIYLSSTLACGAGADPNMTFAPSESPVATLSPNAANSNYTFVGCATPPLDGTSNETSSLKYFFGNATFHQNTTFDLSPCAQKRFPGCSLQKEEDREGYIALYTTAADGDGDSGGGDPGFACSNVYNQRDVTVYDPVQKAFSVTFWSSHRQAEFTSSAAAESVSPSSVTLVVRCAAGVDLIEGEMTSTTSDDSNNTAVQLYFLSETVCRGFDPDHKNEDHFSTDGIIAITVGLAALMLLAFVVLRWWMHRNPFGDGEYERV